jgi:integrase
LPNEGGFLLIRDRAMLETLYSAAMRVSELCGMDWQDVDWNKREVKVLGKGNKERVCALGQKSLEALLEYSRHYEHKWEKKPDGPAPGVPLNVGHANQHADNSPDDPQMVQTGRRQARQSARLQAQRGNSHARERHRYSSDSKAARTRVDHYDRNLHASGNP